MTQEITQFLSAEVLGGRKEADKFRFGSVYLGTEAKIEPNEMMRGRQKRLGRGRKSLLRVFALGAQPTE